MVLDQPQPLDHIFHALAHPARRSMLRQLAHGEQNLSELAAPLKMSFPAASKHVRVLERARLVRRRKVGRAHICRIEGEPLGRANQWLEDYRRIWEGNFQRLDDLLGEMQGLSPSPTAAPPPARAANAPPPAPRKQRPRKHAARKKGR